MKADITYSEKYDPAMAVSTQAEADAYFEECVEHAMSFGYARREAERIERTNIAYWAGYFSHSTRERVERLFACEHPFFGSIAENGPPTPEQAFESGLMVGRAMRRAKESR